MAGTPAETSWPPEPGRGGVELQQQECAEGRGYADIDKTAQMRFDLGQRGE